MSGYVCGWDGGGTKTEVLCLSLNGETLADAAFGPLNLNGADVEIDNIKVVYKHIRKDGTKESFGVHKTKVSMLASK